MLSAGIEIVDNVANNVINVTGKIVVNKYTNVMRVKNLLDSPTFIELIVFSPRRDFTPQEPSVTKYIQDGFRNIDPSTNTPLTTPSGGSWASYDGTSTYQTPGLKVFDNKFFCERFKVRKVMSRWVRAGGLFTFKRSSKRPRNFQMSRLWQPSSSSSAVILPATDGFFNYLKGFSMVAIRFHGSDALATGTGTACITPTSILVTQELDMEFSGTYDNTSIRYYNNNLDTSGANAVLPVSQAVFVPGVTGANQTYIPTAPT